MTANDRAEILPDLARASNMVKFGNVFPPNIAEAVVTRMSQLYTDIDKNRLPECRALVDEVLAAAKTAR